MVMMLKITGVEAKAVTPLHEMVAALKPGKDYVDRFGGPGVICLARIVTCKLDETYGTYTIELRVTVKVHGAMFVSHSESQFGEYFAPLSVLTQLFSILSLGQQAQIFPANELLVKDDVGRAARPPE